MTYNNGFVTFIKVLMLDKGDNRFLTSSLFISQSLERFFICFIGKFRNYNNLYKKLIIIIYMLNYQETNNFTEKVENIVSIHQMKTRPLL